MKKLPALNIIGFDLTRSFQLGGNIEISDEKKQELFPYFAYLYSQQMDPEKYGSTTSMEEWSNLIQENEEDVNKITQVASQLSDEDWESIDKQYAEAKSGGGKSESDQIAFAAKGAKLKKLKTIKKKVFPFNKKDETPETEKVSTKAEGGAMKKKVVPKGKKKKCTCGCDLILSKAAGGKVIETCSCKCGGKMKKKK